MKSSGLFIASLALAFFLPLTAESPACSVPVFRYALDRWEADDYTLAHRDYATEKPALAAKIDEAKKANDTNLNTQPAATPDTADELIRPGRTPSTVWKGALTEETLALLLDSPARQEVVKRIVAGESAVWVVWSDSPDGGAAFAKRLSDRLAYLAGIMALPEPDGDPDSWVGSGPPVRIAFSVLQIAKDNPAEEFFARLLAGPELPHDKPLSGSWAVPVFGQGRALEVFHEADLADTLIDQICQYVTGACSCEIKEQNPGWDLLIKADWFTLLDAAGQAAAKAAAAATTPEVQPATPQKSAVETVTVTPAKKSGQRPLPQKLVGMLWIGVMLMSVATLMLIRILRKRHGSVMNRPIRLD